MADSTAPPGSVRTIGSSIVTVATARDVLSRRGVAQVGCGRVEGAARRPQHASLARRGRGVAEDARRSGGTAQPPTQRRTSLAVRLASLELRAARPPIDEAESTSPSLE